MCMQMHLNHPGSKANHWQWSQLRQHPLALFLASWTGTLSPKFVEKNILMAEKICFLGAYLAIQCPYHICINLFVWYVCVGSAKNINKSTKRWENLRFKLRNLRGSYSAREFPRPRHIRNPHRASAFCRCSEVAFPDEASEMMMLMMNQKKQDVLVIKNEKWWVLSLEWTFTGEHC